MQAQIKQFGNSMESTLIIENVSEASQLSKDEVIMQINKGHNLDYRETIPTKIAVRGHPTELCRELLVSITAYVILP